MKKSKLSIRKFKIATLNDPSKIMGGTGTGADDGGTNTGNTNDGKERCLLTSLIKMPDNSIVKS
ncbi:hypothetical protein CW736_02060 [Nonlabens sp. MB-3u-79]|uniref:hypothetical protein n=1 Tax=Nonlabens sp. MB-3u-79 TaxID=2058134 RepID=UPI000C31A312|nr:hypothetical protein [Nonlabens sp. MB-3u-79]AUC78260.1 hypothetical protein CW736_02060 [Nonlabens sp. MB-3u-79]